MDARQAGPLRVHAPRADVVPLVLDSPHSGEHYPEDFDHAPPRAVVRRAEDTHVGRLYASAPSHGAALLEATFPRAYLDANRSLEDIDPELLADGWERPLAPSGKTDKGIGLVWRIARDGSPMYARKLTRREVEARIERCWRPYHAALDALLDDTVAAFGAAWHLNCHSMPAVGDANADDPGRERADFVLGDRDGTTCAPQFTALVAATLRGFGYSVAINDPYKGVELVRAYSNPRTGRHSLQIEISKRLYMDEATLQKSAGFTQLQKDLSGLLGEIKTYL
jgi:N-formylglutamate deformylase